MTRAIIYLIGVNGSTLKLYCNHDGYVRRGLGEALYLFCERQEPGVSPAEVLYALFIDKDNRLDLNRSGDEIVDYVYRIICSPSGRPQLMCWKVDWHGDKRPLAERMGDQSILNLKSTEKMKMNGRDCSHALSVERTRLLFRLIGKELPFAVMNHHVREVA